MLIAQLSDIHVGASRYRQALLQTAIAEINEARPDVVVLGGDLTDEGYPDQYPLAKKELAALECEQLIVVPGNHDARNVGYLRFEGHLRRTRLAAPRAGRRHRGRGRRRRFV